jgi:D-3-phosphoglycerate dehydrogenase / 2-oxoglutarate reductase
MLALNLEENLFKTKALEILQSKVAVVNTTTADIILEKNPSAEILIVKLGHQINETLLSKLPKLRYIVCPTTGLDHIDLEYCAEKKIEVLSVRGQEKFLSQITSTSEIAWWHILELSRNANDFQNKVVEGEWNRNQFVTESLQDKVLGICGYGRLGKQMATIGRAFGMKVIVHDKQPNQVKGIERTSTISELFNLADVVTLHIDASEENKSLINRKLINEISKPKFLLVNTSRGSIVDEQAIVEALKTGKIHGYGADVLDGETRENYDWLEMSKIWQAKKTNEFNITLTPHIGGATKDSQFKVENEVVMQLNNRLKI